MNKVRVNIPHKIADEVMFKSQRKCYCGERGDEIHHIDSNRSNNDFDNLVLLCNTHHDDASVRNGLKRRLNPRQIKQHRNELYKQNEQKKRIELEHYGKTLKKITDENLFRAALDASITVEIIKIRYEFFKADNWVERDKILDKIYMYSDYKSMRIAYEVVHFYDRIASITRSGVTSNIACTLSGVSDFFPSPKNEKEKKQITEFAQIACNTAFAITYDALIKLGNLSIASWGLVLFKDIYHLSKELKIPSISEYVLKRYAELESTLKRPERNDLENAQRIVKSFKNDLDSFGLLYPNDLPDDLFQLIQEHHKKTNQRRD